jgi:hypothetical protein
VSTVKVKPASASSRWSQLGLVILFVMLGPIIGSGYPWIAQRFSDQIALLVPLGIFGGAVLLVLLRRVSLVVFLVVLYAPVELFVQKWLPDTIGAASRFVSEALLLFILAALFTERLLLYKPWKRTPLDVPLFIFISVGVLSALVNQVPPLVAVLGLRILLRYVLLFYLVVQIGFSRKATRRLIVAMLGVASVVFGIGLAQALIGPSLTEVLHVAETKVGTTVLRESVSSGVSLARGRYIFSTLGRYDMLGQYTVIILLLLLALYLYYPRRRGILRWLILTTGICLLLTMSRQSWLAMYAALWSWALLSKKKWAIGLLPLLLLVPVTLVGMAYLFPHLVRYYPGSELVQATILTRSLEMFSSEYFEVSAYSAGRLYVLRYVGQRILQLVPLLGFGPGRFGSLTATYFQFSAAESLGMAEGQVRLVNDVNWISILGQYGLIGTLAFLVMFVALWRYARRMYKRLSDPLAKSVALVCVGSIVAFLVLGFFGPNFEQRVISMYVWLIAGLTVALARAEQRAVRIQ